MGCIVWLFLVAVGAAIGGAIGASLIGSEAGPIIGAIIGGLAGHVITGTLIPGPKYPGDRNY